MKRFLLRVYPLQVSKNINAMLKMALEKQIHGQQRGVDGPPDTYFTIGDLFSVDKCVLSHAGFARKDARGRTGVRVVCECDGAVLCLPPRRMSPRNLYPLFFIQQFVRKEVLGTAASQLRRVVLAACNGPLCVCVRVLQASSSGWTSAWSCMTALHTTK